MSTITSIGQTERSVRFVYKLFLFADRRLVCWRGYVKIHVGNRFVSMQAGLLILLFSYRLRHISEEYQRMNISYADT